MSILLLNLLWHLSVLAMVALGLAVVFGLLRIMNMAHGEFVMLGAYSPLITQMLGLPAYWQLPVCLILICSLAYGIERLLIRHFYGRLFDSLLVTWGLSILLRELIELFFGRGYQSTPLPISGSWSIFGVGYPSYRLLVILAIILFFILLWLWYKKSRIATQIKAMVSNPELAEVHGINTQRMSTLCFVVGCACAGVAGLLIAPTTVIEPLMGLDFLIRSFFALVVGGLGSLEGLMMGVGIIGGLQSVLSALFNQTYGYLMILCVAILFLWLKPNGIRSSL